MIDSLLPSMLRHENISGITERGIYIIDRRALPFSHEAVICNDYIEAAAEIRNMVTQGGGPLEVALNTMLFTYHHDRKHLDDAVKALSDARPTNTTMKRELASVMERYSSGEEMDSIISSVFERYDEIYDRISDIGESVISDGDGILTTCFPEHTFMLSVKKAMMNGKHIKVYVPETRPYLQGAHLTEPCLRELGIPCFLITDGMGAHFMREKSIQKYMTASDLALSDRTIVNKTGTLGNAIAAKRYGIPYFAFSVGLDMGRSRDDVIIEYRDGESIKQLSSVKIAEDEAKAIYPCFDIIDPDLVSGIITVGGII